MKKLFLALPVVFTAVFAAQEPARTVVYSLAPGERLLQAESVLAVSAGAADVVLVLAAGKGDAGPFFVFRDGKKSGPFVKLEEAMASAYQGREAPGSAARDCATYAPGDPPEDAAPEMDTDSKGGQILKFKGRSFGPFALIFTSHVTPDGALAYFTAADKDKAWFGCSDGRKVSFKGVPGEFKFSPDGRSAAIVVEGSMSLADMENMGKLPPDKLQAALASQDKRSLYTIDGLKFGPFDSSFSSSSVWYPATSNDLYFEAYGQVFRNGAPYLKNDAFDPCAFYVSPDGRSYALFTYESLSFSDGKTYPPALGIAVFQAKGKTVFRWITLEKDKDIVVYERAM
jgi:hypothetical protein